MKKILLVSTFVLPLLIICNRECLSQEAKGKPLPEGQYILKMALADGPKDQQVQEHSAFVVPHGLFFKIGVVFSGTGAVINAEGTVKGESICFGLTEIEKGSILSLHYNGKHITPIQDDGLIAKGKLSIIKDGKIAAKGTWELKRRIYKE